MGRLGKPVRPTCGTALSGRDSVATLIVAKTKTVIVPISLGFNVVGWVFTADLRATVVATSALIATWIVTFDTDGKDGELIATLQDTITSGLTVGTAYMRLKRIIPSPTLEIFGEPVLTSIQNPT